MFSIEKLKQRFYAILSLDAHPGHISAAFAVGVFISFIPPAPGLHTGLAILIAFMLRLNKIACVTGSMVNTYLTTIPTLIISHKIGAYILHTNSSISIEKLDWAHIKTMLLNDAKPLLLGCSILGFCASILAYTVCYRLIVVFRSKDPILNEQTEEMEITGEELK